MKKEPCQRVLDKDSTVQAFYEKLLADVPAHTPFIKAEPISGGCIHHALRLCTQDKDYFLKWNVAPGASDMFKMELDGLQRLQKAGLRSPNPIATGRYKKKAYLLLEYVEPGPAGPHYWEQLGEQLAQLHSHHAPQFGLEVDNFIGALPQKNTQQEHWIDFLIHQRFSPLVTAPPLPPEIISVMDRLYARLPSILPKESPALLHGDLWSGNLHRNQKGEPCWIDPAIYYGAREMELTLPILFGGFSSRFFQAYRATTPLLSGWEERVELYTLYPLLVHIHLFGSQYLESFRQRLMRFL